LAGKNLSQDVVNSRLDRVHIGPNTKKLAKKNEVDENPSLALGAWRAKASLGCRFAPYEFSRQKLIVRLSLLTIIQTLSKNK